ncbi:hypothetical protein Daus18300_012671 [Diaporthe australafricana]|uniref:Transmembrane protein n=1 Tax=Diaporthe australafricana TaxID=127596 RepID=A0ABR3W1T6_9PEZI
MVRIYGSENTVSWPLILTIIYGIFVVVTAFLALLLTHRGGEPYQLMPERHRNRRWVKPLLPIIFIILPALLWPLVMVGIIVTAICFVVYFLAFDTDSGIWRRMRGTNKGKDEESGPEADKDLPNVQSSSEHNRLGSEQQTETATTISKPPPAYTPHSTPPRLPQLAR